MKGDKILKKALKKAHKDGARGSILTRSGLNLTLRQESFARAFADINSPTFNNAAASFRTISTTQGDNKSVANQASKLKNKPVVSKRIMEILEQSGFNDFTVDVEHHKLVTQDKDYSTKLGAIKEYNRLRGRGKESGSIINVEITNYGSPNNQDPSSVRAPKETVSVRDLGESS